MKKLLIASLMFGMLGIVASTVEAKTIATVTADPQIDVRIRQPVRYRRTRTRTVTTTRIRWVDGARYRETIRTTYFANGRTRTVVVNRVRISGRRYNRNY